MACRKAFDLDLVACLLDAARPEWSEFREHYPRCPECATEVRTWTELQSTLAPPHPSPEDLIGFESRANVMAPEARKAIAAHIATCRSCRDELRALHAFDPRSVTAEARGTGPKRRWWRPVGRLVLHPAFAYGIALVLAIPVLFPRLARQLGQELAARSDDLARLARPDTNVPARSPEPVQVTSGIGRQPAHELTAEPGTLLGTDGPDDDVAGKSLRAVPGAPQGAGEAPAARAAEDESDQANTAATAPALDARVMAKSAPAPEARRKAAASEEWPVVVLTTEREIVLRAPTHGLVLRLAPPRSQPALPPGLAWLRVRDAAGRRELREQQFGTPGSDTEIRVPANWLEPGSYRVDIVLGDDARPVSVARFRIES